MGGGEALAWSRREEREREGGTSLKGEERMELISRRAFSCWSWSVWLGVCCCGVWREEEEEEGGSC